MDWSIIKIIKIIILIILIVVLLYLIYNYFISKKSKIQGGDWEYTNLNNILYELIFDDNIYKSISTIKQDVNNIFKNNYSEEITKYLKNYEKNNDTYENTYIYNKDESDINNVIDNLTIYYKTNGLPSISNQDGKILYSYGYKQLQDILISICNNFNNINTIISNKFKDNRIFYLVLNEIELDIYNNSTNYINGNGIYSSLYNNIDNDTKFMNTLMKYYCNYIYTEILANSFFKNKVSEGNKIEISLTSNDDIESEIINIDGEDKITLPKIEQNIKEMLLKLTIRQKISAILLTYYYTYFIKVDVKSYKSNLYKLITNYIINSKNMITNNIDLLFSTINICDYIINIITKQNQNNLYQSLNINYENLYESLINKINEKINKKIKNNIDYNKIISITYNNHNFIITPNQLINEYGLICTNIITIDNDEQYYSYISYIRNNVKDDTRTFDVIMKPLYVYGKYIYTFKYDVDYFNIIFGDIIITMDIKKDIKKYLSLKELNEKIIGKEQSIYNNLYDDKQFYRDFSNFNYQTYNQRILNTIIEKSENLKNIMNVNNGYYINLVKLGILVNFKNLLYNIDKLLTYDFTNDINNLNQDNLKDLCKKMIIQSFNKYNDMNISVIMPYISILSTVYQIIDFNPIFKFKFSDSYNELKQMKDNTELFIPNLNYISDPKIINIMFKNNKDYIYKLYSISTKLELPIKYEYYEKTNQKVYKSVELFIKYYETLSEKFNKYILLLLLELIIENADYIIENKDDNDEFKDVIINEFNEYMNINKTKQSLASTDDLIKQNFTLYDYKELMNNIQHKLKINYMKKHIDDCILKSKYERDIMLLKVLIEYFKKQNNISKDNIEQLTKINEENIQKLQELQESERNIKLENDKLKKELEHVKNEYDEKLKELLTIENDKFINDYNKIKEEYNKTLQTIQDNYNKKIQNVFDKTDKKDITNSFEQLKYISDFIDNLQSQNTNDLSKISELENKLEENEKIIENNNKKINELNDGLKIEQNDKEEIIEQIKNLEIINKEFKENNEKLEEELKKAKEEIERLKEKNNELNKNNENLEKQINELKTKREELTSKITENENKIKELENEQNEKNKQIKEMEDEKEKLTNENKRLENKNDELKNENDGLDKQIKEMEDEKEKLKIYNEELQFELNNINEQLNYYTEAYKQQKENINEQKIRIIELEKIIDDKNMEISTKQQKINDLYDWITTKDECNKSLLIELVKSENINKNKDIEIIRKTKQIEKLKQRLMYKNKQIQDLINQIKVKDELINKYKTNNLYSNTKNILYSINVNLLKSNITTLENKIKELENEQIRLNKQIKTLNIKKEEITRKANKDNEDNENVIRELINSYEEMLKQNSESEIKYNNLNVKYNQLNQIYKLLFNNAIKLYNINSDLRKDLINKNEKINRKNVNIISKNEEINQLANNRDDIIKACRIINNYYKQVIELMKNENENITKEKLIENFKKYINKEYKLSDDEINDYVNNFNKYLNDSKFKTFNYNSGIETQTILIDEINNLRYLNDKNKYNINYVIDIIKNNKLSDDVVKVLLSILLSYNDIDDSSRNILSKYLKYYYRDLDIDKPLTYSPTEISNMIDKIKSKLYNTKKI